MRRSPAGSGTCDRSTPTSATERTGAEAMRGEVETADPGGPTPSSVQLHRLLGARGEGPHAEGPQLPADADAATLVGSSFPVLVQAGDDERPRYTFEAVFASGGLGQIRRAYDHRL